MNQPPFVQAMFNDIEWRKHVATVGLIGARTELSQLKAELKLQRRERLGDDDYKDFLIKQAKFERIVTERLSAIERTLSANPEPPGSKYRQRIRELTDLIGHLARALDETEMEHLLDDFQVPFGDDWMTLGDALDAGRFDRTEAAAS